MIAAPSIDPDRSGCRRLRNASKLPGAEVTRLGTRPHFRRAAARCQYIYGRRLRLWRVNRETTSMTILTFLAAAVVLAAAAYGWHAKNRRTAEPPKGVRHRPAAARPAAGGGRLESGAKSGDDTTTTTAFACVEIRVPQSGCSAAKAIAQQSFLASEAPALPLEACTASRCRCSFHKSSDRRQDRRRWKDEGVEVTLFNAPEKRQSGDRRRSDTAD
jgi:hypothetical protein